MRRKPPEPHILPQMTPEMTRFLTALLHHCYTQSDIESQPPDGGVRAPPTPHGGASFSLTGLQPHHDLVGSVGPAASVVAQFGLAPEAPRRPVVGGRLVTQVEAARAAQVGRGGAGPSSSNPATCHECTFMQRALASGAPRPPCTHMRTKGANGEWEHRPDTPDGYWSGGTDDVPSQG